MPTMGAAITLPHIFFYISISFIGNDTSGNDFVNKIFMTNYRHMAIAFKSYLISFKASNFHLNSRHILALNWKKPIQIKPHIDNNKNKKRY